MMHGREKSDSAIVAVKPANKAERSAAEQTAEPRRSRWSEGGKPRRMWTSSVRGRTERCISVSQMWLAYGNT